MNCYICSHKNVCKFIDILDKITNDASPDPLERKEHLSEQIGYACLYYSGETE